MKYKHTEISGLLIFEGFLFNDIRGELVKPFSSKNIIDLDINLNFKETWFTKSKKNVIRGMHLQVGNMACEKFVSVISGSVVDIILDVRKNSNTYGKFFEIELTSNNPKSLYIPKGCAHGYKVLESDTITMYMATEFHSSDHDLGYRWDSFGYNWNISDPIISERDKNLEAFN